MLKGNRQRCSFALFLVTVHVQACVHPKLCEALK